MEKTIPLCHKNWENNWDVLSPFYKFPKEIQKIIYTTNAIEGLHRQFRKITKTKTIFSSDESIEKMLYLASLNVMKKGTQRYRNWNQVLSQLMLIFEGRHLYGIDKNISHNSLAVPLHFTRHDIEECIPFPDNAFDVVMCSYALMFIEPLKQKFVVRELMRVANRYLLIETNRLKSSMKKTHYKDYSFDLIVHWIETNTEFTLLQVRKYSEKIMAVRRNKNA